MTYEQNFILSPDVSARVFSAYEILLVDTSPASWLKTIEILLYFLYFYRFSIPYNSSVYIEFQSRMKTSSNSIRRHLVVVESMEFSTHSTTNPAPPVYLKYSPDQLDVPSIKNS